MTVLIALAPTPTTLRLHHRPHNILSNPLTCFQSNYRLEIITAFMCKRKGEIHSLRQHWHSGGGRWGGGGLGTYLPSRASEKESHTFICKREINA